VSTSSYTYTYSVTDVRKVMSQLHAEFRMAAQSTGLRTTADVDEVMADITRFAEEGYLERVHLRLVNASGKNIKVADYEVSEDAGGWSADRAGNMLWPRGFGVRLTATLYYSPAWHQRSAAQQAAFKDNLNRGWSTTTDDLSTSHLTARADRTFASNAYGVKKTVHG